MLLLAGLVGGCASTKTEAGSSPSASSVSGPPAPSASGSAAFCPAADDLKTSVSDLRNINVVSGGVAAIQQAIAKIQTNLNAFQAAAQSQFGPEITQLRTSLSGVQTALQSAKGNLNISSITAIATSVAGVVGSYNTLHSAISSRCG